MTSDFSSSIVRLGGVNYTVKRYTAGQRFTDGKRDAPESTTITVVALVHPATGKDLQLVTEAMRSSQVISIFSSSELLTVDEATQQQPDEITYGGVQFQVARCEPWQQLGNFFRCLARKVA